MKLLNYYYSLLVSSHETSAVFIIANVKKKNQQSYTKRPKCMLVQVSEVV